MSQLQRRSFLETRKVSTTSSNLLLDPQDKNWIIRYLEISSCLNFADFDKYRFGDIHLDILRDLCNESLDCNIIIHLLSLLEQMIPFLSNSEDKIEQTIGSLLNILNHYKNDSRRVRSTNKCFFSTTIIVLYFQELRFSNKTIDNLGKEFISLIIRESEKKHSLYREACEDCILEITSTCPELIENLNKSDKSLYLLPWLAYKKDYESINNLMRQLKWLPDLKFYHICTYIYDLITKEGVNEQLPIIILKPYLKRFVENNSIHYIHFALRILLKFGFEIFSSEEEERLMKQLVQCATLPSLPIGQRLMALMFIRVAFASTFKPPLNSPPLSLLNQLYPLAFDGPDTQEKKLIILNESTFTINDDEFFNILISLFKQTSSNYHSHERSTNSLFRVLNISLQHRPQMKERILKLLLDNVFSELHTHYIKKLDKFLNDHWDFAQMIVDKFIARLMMMGKEQEIHDESYPLIISYKQYVAFLDFINWFLSIAHHNIKLTEFQLEFIIRFIQRNSAEKLQSCTLGLACCTSILYYQRVTDKVKEALLGLFEWLKNECKSDLETSSLAQIYLLALRTLKEENIRQVFTSDEEEFMILKPNIHDQYLANIVQYDPGFCPVRVDKISSLPGREKQKYGTPLVQRMEFDVCLDSEMPLFDRVFCISIKFTTDQASGFQRIFQIPFLEQNQHFHISLPLEFKINVLFQFNISVKFTDYKGIIYSYLAVKNESVLIEDIFVPLQIEPGKVDELTESVLLHPESLQTVICVKHHNSFESFFSEHGWMEKFVADNSNKQVYNFAIGLCPDRIIIGSIKVTNQYINLYVITNSYQVIPILYHKFNSK